MFHAIYYRLEPTDEWHYYTGVKGEESYASQRAVSIFGSFLPQWPEAQISIKVVDSPTQALSTLPGKELEPLPFKVVRLGKPRQSINRSTPDDKAQD